MKTGIISILVLGCLLALLLTGCQILNSPSPNSSSDPYTNEVLVPQSGATDTPHSVNNLPADFHDLQDTNHPISPAETQYDHSMISSIESYWQVAIESHIYKTYEIGEVIIGFQLHADGSVTNVIVVKSTVGSHLTSICVDAVNNTAPYQKWPVEMLKAIGDSSREK